MYSEQQDKPCCIKQKLRERLDMNKKVWSTDELANMSQGRVNLPDNIFEYDIIKYPHWALIISIHLGRHLNTEDIESNISLIEMLPYDSALDIRIDDLREIGVVV
jgi:hypothetical protein